MKLQSLLCWLGIHSYSKWENAWKVTYKNTYGKPYKQTTIQERHCTHCGKLSKQEV